jgi:hypothetical protein
VSDAAAQAKIKPAVNITQTCRFQVMAIQHSMGLRPDAEDSRQTYGYVSTGISRLIREWIMDSTRVWTMALC